MIAPRKCRVEQCARVVGGLKERNDVVEKASRNPAGLACVDRREEGIEEAKAKIDASRELATEETGRRLLQ